MNIKAIDSCRICGSKELTPVINLGSQLLASVTVSHENQDRYPSQAVPIEVVRCNPAKNKNACGLVQLRHTFPGDLIYREYWYRSGINQTMRDALKDVIEGAGHFVDLIPGDTVVDIGCNDGTLLNSYTQNFIDRIGFDPVENIRGEKENFRRVVDFFNRRSFEKACPTKKAKVITSIAMFYDLDDPNTFVSDIASILHTDGVWVVQMADLPEMLEQNMFDQIFHEHLEYYHIRPFRYLVERHGLKIVDMEKNTVNGSSYRFYLRKKEGSEPSAEANVRLNTFFNEEKKLKLDEEEPYKKFRENSERIRDKLTTFIRTENKKGKKTFVYGASSKGNVILQYCSLTVHDIPYAADRNSHKAGCWTVGSNIPIISEEEARMKKPDYFLVLPYFFMDEMIKREFQFLKEGGKFIVPMPQVHCLDSSILKK